MEGGVSSALQRSSPGPIDRPFDKPAAYYCALATHHYGHQTVSHDFETTRTRLTIHTRPATLTWYSSTPSWPLTQPSNENSKDVFGRVRTKHTEGILSEATLPISSARIGTASIPYRNFRHGSVRIRYQHPTLLVSSARPQKNTPGHRYTLPDTPF